MKQTFLTAGPRALLLCSRAISVIAAICLLTACAELAPVSRSGDGAGAPSKAPQLDPVQGRRVSAIMLPLIQHMNRPIGAQKVRVGVYNKAEINAANAGGGQFYVTTGLLQRASDEQLRGVLAHEVAHEDLGHVAKTQALGTGLKIGSVLLNQIIPGSGTVTPLIADIGVLRPYSRQEEYEADTHGVAILNRAGYNGKKIMTDTLTWLLQTSGSGGNTLLSDHPGTEDRIKRIQGLP
jgi:Zn-dependent protease with chaperone function